MIKHLSTVTFAVLYCLAGFALSISTDPIVKTQYGKVRGTVRYASGSSKPVFSYFGVKYGRSPDYVFRFQPPENPWDWDEIRNATDESRPMCVQDMDRYESLRAHTYLKHITPDRPRMSEDCLLLDIFTPISPGESSSAVSLPVVIWIHGGSFDAFFSTTKLWALPAFEEVVLVQVQYRLGVFGFYTTHDEWAPENNALHDQIKAMHWVKKNIHAFGGDPETVTLMGESAGSIAATAHMLIPSNVGLFHRVIGLSGTPESAKWHETFLGTARKLGESANCNFESTGAIGMCLQNKVSTSTLMRFAKTSGAHFSLSEDIELFPDKVGSLVAKGAFANEVPIMLSVTGGETNYVLSRKVFPHVYNKGKSSTKQELQQAMQKHLNSLYDEGIAASITDIVTEEYFDGNSSITQFQGFLEAVADSWFVSQAARFAEKAKENGQSTYLMKFNVKPSMYDAMPDKYRRPYKFSSADHADDLLYAFGFPFVSDFIDGNNPPMSFTAEEKNTSRKYMKTIAHFAKTGFPPKELDWSQYPNFLEVGDTWKMKSHLLSDKRMHLWNNVFREILYSNKS